MIMKLGNVNIDEGSNVLAKNRDSPWCNEGVIFLSTLRIHKSIIRLLVGTVLNILNKNNTDF